MRPSLPVLGFSISAFALITASAGAEIAVRQSDDQWQVSADGDALSEVLNALRDEADFRLVGADRLIDDRPVTADLSGELGDILARLLAGYDYALVYGDTPQTQSQLQRVVLLSGRSGEAPDESQRLRVERISEGVSEEDGARVSDMLQRQVQPLIDAENGVQSGEAADSNAAVASADGAAAPSPTNGSDDDYALDPETQAALAEATLRAQQDLQALVNALQAAEGNDN
ncbi:hypothetical protein [Hyphobacterium sp.]|uniref:hypothetical protein n=1 Tax=Hyphobacterium sp. TaxID=2004662 RepID=UPI003BAC7D83